MWTLDTGQALGRCLVLAAKSTAAYSAFLHYKGVLGHVLFLEITAKRVDY